MEYRAAEAMERDLSIWRKSLPGYFAPEAEVPSWFQVPRAVVLWKEQNLRILLWRGTQMCHTFLPTRSTAASRCLDVAMQSIHDIAKFCSTHVGPFHQGLTWYATYFIIQATLILHVYGVSSNAPSWNGEEEGRQQDEWRHSMRTAYNCLGFLAQSNKSARRCLEILQRLGVQSQLLPQPSWNEGSSAPPTIGLGPVDSAQPPEQPPAASTDGQFQAGSAPEPAGPYEFQLPSDFGNHFDFDIGPNDPDFRMVLDEMSSDFIDNMPLDLLLGDWNA
jgi:transcriptional regulatory protein GAL4